jgi:hypothetical protein
LHLTGLLFAAPQDEIHRQVVAVHGITQVREGEREDFHFVEQLTKPDFSASLGELENLR